MPEEIEPDDGAALPDRLRARPYAKRVTPTRLNVLLVGEEAAGIRVLEWLAASGHRIVGVLGGRPPGHARTATVAAAAERLGLHALDPKLVTDPAFADRLRRERVDLLLNVHSLWVACGDVVDAPRIGSFNLHPGPLPQYAGLNAPSWAIYNGEVTHAVSLHRMERGIDTGAIAYEASVPIRPADTGLSLSVACARAGPPLVARLIETAASDPRAIPARAQDPALRRYYGRHPPHDGRIPWSAPARRIADFVRAADYGPFPSPWGRPRTRMDDVELAILKAETTGTSCKSPPGTVGPEDKGGVLVAAGDEWLAVQRVTATGAPVRAADVLRSGARLAGPWMSPSGAGADATAAPASWKASARCASSSGECGTSRMKVRKSLDM
jgi:methionyl-tRNA formyltransferase